MICNVKVFSEGVDVPALDAVAFLDPKQSQIDIVQAVGRVMRKAAGKRHGYIVVPVFVPEGEGDIGSVLRVPSPSTTRQRRSTAPAVPMRTACSSPPSGTASAWCGDRSAPTAPAGRQRRCRLHDAARGQPPDAARRRPHPRLGPKRALRGLQSAANRHPSKNAVNHTPDRRAYCDNRMVLAEPSPETPLTC